MATKVKAKKAVKAVKPGKALPAEDLLNSYRLLSKKRYKMAMEVYEAQDNLTKEVIDRICDRLLIASTGVIQIGGQLHKLEQKYIHYNTMFIATEILADLALLNIQVANFEPHPGYCAECKTELFGVPAKKKKRNG